MIRFDDNEFEIAVVTYNRVDFVKKWLAHCYSPAVRRNIKLSIYDSSTNDETKTLVLRFNQSKHNKVNYYHIDENTKIGYKPMIPVLQSESTFLWVSGDSRYHDFEELDIKVFSLIKKRTVDCLIINVDNNYRTPDTIFDNRSKMIHSCFVATTCIGMSIYKTSIFDPIKKDPQKLKEMDDVFRSNYAFAWLGYFYSVYAMNDYKTALVNVKINEILAAQKKQTWASRFMGCWVEDLCQVVDQIPDLYARKGMIPKEVWKVMKLNTIPGGYKARKNGDLTRKKYKELKSNGMLLRVVDNTMIMSFFSIAPLFLIELINSSFSWMISVVVKLSRIKRRVLSLGVEKQ